MKSIKDDSISYFKEYKNDDQSLSMVQYSSKFLFTCAYLD